MYTVIVPPARLSPWVECLWVLAAGRDSRWTELTPADLATDLVFSTGSAYEHVDAAGARRSWTNARIGVRRVPETFEHVEGNRLFGIRLRPGAATRVLAAAGSDLRNVCTLEDVVPRDVLGRFARVLDEATSTAAPPFELVDALLDGAERPDALVTRALVLLDRSPATRIAALASELGVSERTLERRFQQELGVSPKFAARLARLTRARNDLERGLPPTEVAHACGYVDHAHLCADTRQLLGLRPRERHPIPPVCRISPSQA